MTDIAKPLPPAAPGGVLWVLAAAALWGTTGTAQGLAPDSVRPQEIGAIRLLLGGTALMVPVLLRGSLRDGKGWPLVPTAVSVFFVALYQLAFFAGVAVTGVAVGTMVAIGCGVVSAGLLGGIVRRERLGAAWAAATACAFSGCVLLAAAGGGLAFHPLGILLSAGSGVAYAVYTLSMKTLLDRKPPDAVMAVCFSLAALLLLPVLAAGDLQWLAQPRGVAAAVHLGVCATALAYACFARGLRTLTVGTAATLSLAEPLTAALLGIFVLGECLSLPAAAGMLLIMAGLVVMAVSSRAP